MHVKLNIRNKASACVIWDAPYLRMLEKKDRLEAIELVILLSRDKQHPVAGLYIAIYG